MALSEMSTGRSQRVEVVNMEPDQVGNGDGEKKEKKTKRRKKGEGEGGQKVSRFGE